MNSPPSSSESAPSNLHLLDERIQRWVWSKGWTSLRDAQERAIPLILEAKRDLIIAAATAAGKTEAAFLPILSRLVQNGEEVGLALYISPLKALINDQWGRLDQLCEALEIPVVPWHGDIPQSRKQQFLKNPRGVILITPESLEAMFVRRGHEIRRFFGELDYVVIDELHAFIGSDRGKQLQSLLNRIEKAIDRKVPRVALSATLGDMKLAADFLRSPNPDAEIIVSASSGQDLLTQVRGYVADAVKIGAKQTTDDSTAKESIAEHLFRVLHGSNNLLFPNSRSQVEIYSDLLRRRCEKEGIPNEFWPHHGSLSREIREETERALKAGDRPATAVCTNTLELGIDIGAVKSVAQIGPPPSVASLRQRLGRSGRRPGEPAILRAYAIEEELNPRSGLSDRLREGLLQTTAAIRLLVRGWFEPPREGGLHLSTFIQQTLSMLAERGGVTAAEVFRTLVACGPFAGLTPSDIAQLLRELGKRDLIVQEASGLLLLGTLGEQLVGSHDFYAAFQAPEEWQITQEGRLLGTLPIDSPVFEGMCLIFGGRRWRVVSISADTQVLSVMPDPSGTAPKFDSGRPMAHDMVRQEMRQILEERTPIAFLDTAAQQLLEQARAHYRDARLSERQVITSGKNITLLTWRGDLVNNGLLLLLRSLGLPSGSNEGLLISCSGWSEDRLVDALSDIATLPDVDLLGLLRDVGNMRQGKWDWALPDDLLARSFASMNLDIPGAKVVAQRLGST